MPNSMRISSARRPSLCVCTRATILSSSAAMSSAERRGNRPDAGRATRGAARADASAGRLFGRAPVSVRSSSSEVPRIASITESVNDEASSASRERRFDMGANNNTHALDWAPHQSKRQSALSSSRFLSPFSRPVEPLRASRTVPLTISRRPLLRKIGRGALLPFRPQLSRAETFFQHARELLCLQAQLGPNLLGSQAVLMLLDEGYDSVEFRGNVIRRTARKASRGGGPNRLGGGLRCTLGSCGSRGLRARA